MSRSVSWRRVCPEELSARINESLQSTLYILNQTGPTGFIIKQDDSDKKFKVLLGDPHSCTCPQFKRGKELCMHILWLMLKKFRIPDSNPIVFQLGLVEREIQEVLSGHFKIQSPKQSDELTGISHSSSCDQRPISPNDVCPICQESLVESPQRLSYCKYGCGNSVHLKCIKMWADHQKSQGELLISCPLCREKFSTFQELYEELHGTASRRGTRAGRESLHPGVSCDHCHICPIAGKCYKCDLCPNYFLCSSCFNSNHHYRHPFTFRQHPSHVWRSATRSSVPTLPAQSLIEELHNRELTENDYELLLGLDNPPSLMIGTPSTTTRIPQYVLNSFHTEPLDHDNKLIRQGRHCRICSEPYQRGDWVRKLPCKHHFHRECIDDWLCNEPSHDTCPVDDKVVYDNSKRCTNKRASIVSSRRASMKSGCRPTVQKELGMSISGQGLSLKKGQEDEAMRSGSSGKPTSNRLRKGSMLLSTIPEHRRKLTGINDNTQLSLQAIPLTASSDDSSGQDVAATSVCLAKGNVSKLALDTTKSNRVFRRGSLPVSLVAKRREDSKDKLRVATRQRDSLPKIQHHGYQVVRMHKALSTSTLSAKPQDSLPPIDAHLKDRQ